MKNNYEIRGNVTAIFIDSPKYGLFETLISTSKLVKAREFSAWRLYWKESTQSFYVIANSSTKGKRKRETIYLHRLVIGAASGLEVDHEDHDTLNNTDTNLREVTHSQNQQNRKGAARNSKSGIRGVIWRPKDKKWRAQIKKGGKVMYFGEYKTIEEAEAVVIAARKEYMPFSIEA